jgi:hypothetical protein
VGIFVRSAGRLHQRAALAAFGPVELERLEDDQGRVQVAGFPVGGARFWVEHAEGDEPGALGGGGPCG